MAEAATRFAYSAFDQAGKPISGEIHARDRDAAFDQLKARGLSPKRVEAANDRLGSLAAASLSDRDLAAFIADLAALLRAGADVRMALSIAAPARAKPALRNIARQMSTDIAGGEALDKAVARHLPQRHAFVAALATAGAASGDLAGGLERAAELMESRLEARDRLVGILAYPAFVLVGAIVAFGVILLVVIPSLAPLASQPGVRPGAAMNTLLAISGFLRGNMAVIVGVVGLAIVAGAAGGVFGLWGPLLDRLLLNGPFRKTAAALTYGAFAVSLGGLLSVGAPMTEALRLALRTTRSPTARKALDRVLKEVRQGERLSAALGKVPAVPESIVRLTVIGEQSAALGPMLARAGRFEERAAFRQIEVGARILGPVLIIALGGLIGLMMAGLLSGLSDLGGSSLQQ